MKMKKKRKSKQKIDLTILLHIIIVVLIIVIVWAIFSVGGQKDVNNLVKNTENMYQEKVEDTKKITVENILSKEQLKQLEPFVKYNFKYTYTLNIPNKMDNVTFQLQIPSDENEVQYISNLKITPTPSKTFHDGVNNIAEFSFDNIKPQNLNISIEGIANVRTYDLKTAKVLNKNISKEKDLSRYLKEEPLIESNDNYIKKIAAGIKGETIEEIVQNTYVYTQNALTYTIIPRNIGAKEALKIKKGKCSEYAAVMVALLRAKNIPARIVCGNIARDKYQKHSWVEVYFDKYGWVNFDPTTEGTVVNVYKNGKLQKQEVKYNTEKNLLRYIASSRNFFSPWFISYSTSNTKSGRISVSDNIITTKAEEHTH